MDDWLDRTSQEEAKEPKIISFPTSLNFLSLGSTVKGWGGGGGGFERIKKGVQDDGLWDNGIKSMKEDGVVAWKEPWGSGKKIWVEIPSSIL